MVVAVQVRFDTKDFQYLLTKLPGNMVTGVNNAGFSYAKLTRNSLRRHLRSVSKSRSGGQIRAIKKGNNRSVVTMPQKLMYLDSMRPHFVALKRGRNITKWTKRHLPLKPNKHNSERKSRVHKGPRGGILFTKGHKSYLFVKPHPFVDRALLRVRNRLRNELRKGVRKAILKSKR